MADSLDELMDRLPTEPLECRKRAELSARHRPVTAENMQESIAWGLLAIAGELAEIRRLERKKSR